MGENKNKNINNIFYGVIGIATLMIAVIGATFAYYTATASNNVITGNMATIDFDLQVAKVLFTDDANGGMIPMSNNMMEQALTKNASTKGICVDDNGNAVCQVYKITVANESTASMFLDGYVTLTGGSGAPEDYETTDDASTAGTNEREWQYSEAGKETTMRWSQAFCTETDGVVTSCTTGGNSTVRPDTAVAISSIGGSDVAASGFNKTQILDTKSAVIGSHKINGNNYDIITKNYIRVSDHLASDAKYDREDDVTSALVYSQYLEANDNNASNNTGDKNSTFKDAQVFYIVIWLSENGHNQTAGSTGTGVSATSFYQGKVTFVSAQGSEVTATFADHIRVTPNTTQ